MPGDDVVEAGARRTKSGATMKSRYRKYRRYIIESRQEISACLKYILFLANFIFWICGIACTILGIYLYAKDYRAVFEAIDFFLNPSILLIVCGCLIFIIAFLGCTGALRENVCMLKLFSLCLFFAYICLVILAFVVFMLFYSDTKTGISIQSLLQSGVSKYHDNDNMRELMDYLQTNLACCGATSQGYKDWNMNPLYNCSPANPTPEQCGVPPSCCRPSATSVVVHVTVQPKINGQSDAVVVPPGVDSPSIVSSSPNNVPNPRCGFHAQDKSITDLQNLVNTDGCLQPLQRVFESNAVIIGAIIGAIIVPVCLSVTFSNVLAKQIERQRYLLEKEARKEERRRRRNRSKFRDPFAAVNTTSAGVEAARTAKRRSSSADVTTLQELSPLPIPLPLSKDASTKLIIEDDLRESSNNAAGPSGVKKPNEVRKHVKIRKRSEDKSNAPLRKRSGNPDLPPLPLEQQEKKRRTSTVENRQSAPLEAVKDREKSGPKFVPPSNDGNVLDEKRKRYPKPSDGGHKKRRSRSKDQNRQQIYNGPIIVELSSTTHDGPSTEAIPNQNETDTSSKSLLDNDQARESIIVISDEKDAGGSRKNSKEQATPAVVKEEVIIVTE